jgi:AcrR family transcriptional regulator
VPKTFTESEREYIKNRLREEAQYCLKQYGVRKTTVDELVKRVNIPKGTFYLFYDSKELLFFDVLLAFHDELHADLKLKLDALVETVTADMVTGLLFDAYKKVEASFLYKLTTNGDLEWLMRKLPPEAVQSHAEKDDLSVEQILHMTPGINKENIKAFSAAMRAIYLSMLHKREIGEDTFDDALRLMIHGVVLQMFFMEGLK